MTCDMEIEQGLTFARARLAKRLQDVSDDPSDAADLALAILALVAARDARRRERPAILKMSDYSTSRPRSSRAYGEDSAPATINFEKAAAAFSKSRAQTQPSFQNSYAESKTPRLKLYRGD